jgi:hypothetical protein
VIAHSPPILLPAMIHEMFLDRNSDDIIKFVDADEHPLVDA